MQYSDVRSIQQTLVKNIGIMLLKGFLKLYFEHVEITEQRNCITQWQQRSDVHKKYAYVYFY